MKYEEFFALLKRYYPLDEGCKLESCVNLYDTWNTHGGEITQYYEDTANEVHDDTN